MKPELAKKCGDIIQGFPALKLLSVFGSEKIILRLKKETADLTDGEMKEACACIRESLPPGDYNLFLSYMRKARGGT